MSQTSVLPSTDATLRINETFFSLQGETSFSGLPTFFIRLTGCPLRCQYCDTEYAFHEGEKQGIDALVAMVVKAGAQYVCVTGGEPLAQPNCLVLLKALCDQGVTVSLETSGAMDISGVDPRVHIILDLKTPASGEVSRNLWANIALIKPIDEIKFVLCTEDDLLWAESKIIEYDLAQKVNAVWFSPSHEALSLSTMAQHIIDKNLPVRMQLQMHKYIWGDETGR